MMSWRVVVSAWCACAVGVDVIGAFFVGAPSSWLRHLSGGFS